LKSGWRRSPIALGESPVHEHSRQTAHLGSIELDWSVQGRESDFLPARSEGRRDRAVRLVGSHRRYEVFAGEAPRGLEHQRELVVGFEFEQDSVLPVREADVSWKSA